MKDNIQKELLTKVIYDESSPSCLRWSEVISRKIRKGSVAGHLHKADKYYKVRYKGKAFRVHRIIWQLFYGTTESMIDHKDGDTTNNRIENLREATHTENMRNSKTKESNKTGVKGLDWDENNKVWRGRIRFEGKRFSKRGKNKQEIVGWLEDIRNKLHGDFARS